MERPEFTSNTEITIQKATLADLGTIQKLNQELCVKENRDFDETINPNYAFSDKGTEYFKVRIESSDGLSILAKVGDMVVGYLVGGIVLPESYRTVTTAAELENMYVQESMRGKGIGDMLVRTFEDWCKQKEVQIIRVVASAQNKRAIQFYKAHKAKEVSVTLEINLVY